MRLTVTFYYLVKEKTITRKRKEQYWEKWQNQHERSNLPYDLLCEYISAYTNLY